MKQLLERQLCSPEECETADVAAVQAAADFSQAQVRMEELTIEEEALELKQQDVNLAKAQVTSNEINLAQAQQRLTDTSVLAPIDGVVTSRGVQVGQIISSGINNVGGGTTVMTVSDLSHLFVLASVDESQIGQVTTGLPVEITVDAYPQARFSGKVKRIAAQGVTVSNVVTFEVKIEVLDRAPASGAAARAGRGTRRGGARAEPTSGGAGTQAGGESSPSGRPFPSPPPAGGEAGTGTPNGPPRSKARLMPEMTANVTIILDQRDDALQVPAEAVWRNKGQRLVEVQLADGKTEERPVEIGITDGVMQEITSGLKAGEQVVIRKNRTESRWRGGGGRGGPPMFMGGPR
jgi:HlyD family secretion protein